MDAADATSPSTAEARKAWALVEEYRRALSAHACMTKPEEGKTEEFLSVCSCRKALAR